MSETRPAHLGAVLFGPRAPVHTPRDVIAKLNVATSLRPSARLSRWNPKDAAGITHILLRGMWANKHVQVDLRFALAGHDPLELNSCDCRRFPLLADQPLRSPAGLRPGAAGPASPVPRGRGPIALRVRARLANDHVFQKLIGRACEAAGLKIKPHPTCFDKFALANADKDTRSLQVCLGQKNIQHNGEIYRIGSEPIQRWWKD